MKLVRLMDLTLKIEINMMNVTLLKISFQSVGVILNCLI